MIYLNDPNYDKHVQTAFELLKKIVVDTISVNALLIGCGLGYKKIWMDKLACYSMGIASYINEVGIFVEQEGLAAPSCPIAKILCAKIQENFKNKKDIRLGDCSNGINTVFIRGICFKLNLVCIDNLKVPYRIYRSFQDVGYWDDYYMFYSMCCSLKKEDISTIQRVISQRDNTILLQDTNANELTDFAIVSVVWLAHYYDKPISEVFNGLCDCFAPDINQMIPFDRNLERADIDYWKNLFGCV